MAESPQSRSEPFAASAVVMVRPAAFASNPETAASNVFQQAGADGDVAGRARAEFDGAVAALRGAGVHVTVFDEPTDDGLPDAVFPNNWLGLDSDGTVVLYPMAVPSRRRERRTAVLDAIAADGFALGETVDLTDLERDETFLEGTGSLVLDRPRRLGFACLSLRTHPAAIEAFERRFGYRIVGFPASLDGAAIYHTNVMLALGLDFALVGLATIDAGDRDRVRAALADTGRTILELTDDQIRRFSGNVLELRGADGARVLAASQSAWDALTDEQRRWLGERTTPVVIPIPTIETHGGGSVRCMLAENFLPRTDRRPR